MYAYKGFEPDLSCRGYRFVMGKNVTLEANCASNGFHCAEDPLDCLSYYSDMDRSIYCLVQPGGDIDEDDRDSKIACTELTILRQLTRKEFFLHALAYMVDHPCRKVSGKVQREHGVSRGGYAIVRGKEPAACGKLGDILAFAREQRETEEICQIAVAEVDGEKSSPEYGMTLILRKERRCRNEKSSLLKMKNLPATEEMLAVAREDVPVKVGSGWNTSYRCRYSGFVRSAVEGGILKVTLYDPDAMRLGGTLPVYEIFMEKEKQQFLTYDRAHDKWRTAKIDYLEWQAKGSNNVWISAVDDAQIRQYLVSDEKRISGYSEISARRS